MNRRDFVKLTATGLLALAMPLTFPPSTTVQTTLESMGFKKSFDLLKVRVGSFQGSDLERTFEVNQSYHHEKGWLRLMKYVKGKGAHIYGRECCWLVEWRPYEKHPQFKCKKFDICTNREESIIKALREDKWGINVSNSFI